MNPPTNLWKLRLWPSKQGKKPVAVFDSVADSITAEFMYKSAYKENFYYRCKICFKSWLASPVDSSIVHFHKNPLEGHDPICEIGKHRASVFTNRVMWVFFCNWFFLQVFWSLLSVYIPASRAARMRLLRVELQELRKRLILYSTQQLARYRLWRYEWISLNCMNQFPGARWACSHWCDWGLHWSLCSWRRDKTTSDLQGIRPQQHCQHPRILGCRGPISHCPWRHWFDAPVCCRCQGSFIRRQPAKTEYVSKAWCEEVHRRWHVSLSPFVDKQRRACVLRGKDKPTSNKNEISFTAMVSEGGGEKYVGECSRWIHSLNEDNRRVYFI